MVVIKYDKSENLLLPGPSFTEPEVYRKSGTHSVDTTQVFCRCMKSSPLIILLIKLNISNNMRKLNSQWDNGYR